MRQKNNRGQRKNETLWKILLGWVLVVIYLFGVVTTTQAWKSTSQRAVNMGQHSTQKQSIYLLKLAKDLEGQPTKIPIEGTVFALYQVTDAGNKQLGDYVRTDNEGKLSFSLTPGEYYVEEVTPSDGYTFDKDDRGMPQKIYPFTVTSSSTNDVPVVTMYNQRLSGSLELNKRIERSDQKELTKEQRAQRFDFTVTFSDKGTYLYQIDGGVEESLHSGEILSLHHGEKAVFTGIPLGVHYVVVEKERPDYEGAADNTSGTITQIPAVVTYINRYAPKLGKLTVSKEVIRTDKQEVTIEQKKQDFSFVFTFSDKKTPFPFETTDNRKGTVTSGDTVSLKHGETVTLTNLPVGLSYMVKEKEAIDYTSHSECYQGSIVSSTPVFLPFINEFGTPTEEISSLQFKKTVVGAPSNPNQLFSFVVTFSDGPNYAYQIDNGALTPHINGELIQLKQDETITFPSLPVGVTYSLKEEPIEDYMAEVTQIDGTIISQPTKPLAFVNHAKEAASLVIKKVGVGEGSDPTKTFTFKAWINGKEQVEKYHLKAGETSSAIPLHVGDTWRIEELDSYTEGYVQTSLINGTGVVTQANQVVEVTQTNTYIKPMMRKLIGKKTWRVPTDKESLIPESITVSLKNRETVVETKEVKGPEWSYSFDVPKYDSAGEEIEYTIEEAPVNHFVSMVTLDTINLTNTYVAPIQSRALSIKKEVTGEVPEQPSDFRFTLTPGKQQQIITGNGTAHFEPQTYTRPGTYTYTISEENDGLIGYTYDSSVYTWTVVVEEQQEILVIVSDRVTKNEERYTDTSLIFKNTFKEAKDKKMTLKGQKTWIHGNNPKDFQPKSLVVYLYVNDRLVQQRQITEADEWCYSFVVPVYDEKGEKLTYQIGEERVPGYRSTVDGWNLINTYQNSTGPTLPSTAGNKPSTGILPSTGEKLLAGGVVFLGIGLLISVLVIVRKRRSR